MRIVNKDELGKMPNGTVFALYTPMILYNDIHILTGSNGDGYWNGELTLLTPFIDNKLVGRNILECNWATVDNAACDYEEDQLFAVFSKSEIMQMINALMWAVTGCEGYFDEDLWLCENRAYSEKTYREIIDEEQIDI